jgi:hypothetical protein
MAQGNCMKVLLIGLNHGFQLEGYNNSEWDKFKSYLYDQCLKEKPNIIAEELNIEAIHLWKASDSVARRVASSLDIDHLFCDPDSDQRKILGIKDRNEIARDLGYGRVLTNQQSNEVDIIERSYWERREKYWLDRLLEESFQKCFFLMGSVHMDSFCSLLRRNLSELGSDHGERLAINDVR